MFKIIRLLVEFIVDTDAKHYDERSQHLLLASSAWPAIIIGFTYLYFVKALGPDWMKNRQPYTLKYVMMLYNVIQVVANSLLTYKAFDILYSNNNFSNWSCLEADRTTSKYALSVVQFLHSYYLLKIFDLMDTVFFVLRKHFNQISFLHVYHHCGMLFAVYIAMRYGVSGQTFFVGFLNTLVHVIMYFYYLMSSIRPSMKNSLWWKKYITQVQMIQFTLNIIHFSAAFLREDCPEPTFVLSYMIIQNFYMLIMFGDFYVKAYVKKPKMKKVTQ